ncbi:MAG: RluA family pseudouridine synthase [Rhodospirillales bacterium]|nr:RluA family pseudouridine synthase [Rhodospirillales bacterium]
MSGASDDQRQHTVQDRRGAAGTGVTLHTVLVADAGIRLDRWFHRHLPGVPHSLLERWLRSGQVRVDGRRAQSGQRLDAGQVLRVPPHGDGGRAGQGSGGLPASTAEVEALRRAILYRDDEIIVVNKPAGLAVQGGTGTESHVDGMLDGLRFDGERPRLVHRLDRDTSGALVLARSARVAAELGEAFRRHEIRKLYWAVVIGGPRRDQGRMDLPLAKLRGLRGDRVRADVAAGDKAITDFHLLARAGRLFAWLALSPLTGRTHQLRVHCATAGMPILGDGKYGLPFEPPPHLRLGHGLHLHARALALPRRGRLPLVITAPLAPHMAATFHSLGFSDVSTSAAADWPGVGPVADRVGRGLSGGR